MARAREDILATGREQTPSIAAGLARDQLQRMYYTMLLSRTLEERMWALNRIGKAPFVIAPWGQEAAQVGAAMAFHPEIDIFRPYYRDLAFVLTIGMSARDVMLDFFAKADAPSSGGRQMTAHYSCPRLRIVTTGSVIGVSVPQAAGLALAAKIKREQSVVYCSMGEGGTSEGDWHEGLNFAGIHKLPVIFYVQNNRYAISTPNHLQFPVTNVADRASGYGMPGVVVDGQNPIAVYEVFRTAVTRARNGGGPTLIEAKTYRVMPHSSDDDDRSYRSPEEVEGWKKRDPILLFKYYLREHGMLTDDEDLAIRKKAQGEVDEATEMAEQAADPPIDTLWDNVYA